MSMVSCAAFAAIEIDKTAAVTSTATRPVTPQALLDDFKYGAIMNDWGCATGTYGSSGSCTASYVSDSNAYSGQTLKLVYDVSTSGSYAGYYSKLGSQDLSGYTTISFYIRSDFGGDFFKIELKNTGTNADTNASSVYISDYLDSGVTTAWQYVTIPLHAFANISDWTSGLEFGIVFQNSQANANLCPTSGVVYIDNITFGTSAVTSVNINKFGNLLGRCALGGNMGSTPNEYPTSPGARYTITSADYYTSPHSMLSEYNVASGDGWAGHYLLFGGGSSGWTTVAHNFSGLNYLSFYVKARTAAENPKVFKIEMIDNYGTRYYVVTGISTGWQFIKIPLSSITSDGTTGGTVLDKTSIKQMNFTYEKWRIEYASGQSSGNGAVYIDDIRFTKL